MYLWLLLLFISTQHLQAQNWRSATNISYLKRLSFELDSIYREYQKTVQTFAFERDVLVREVYDNGRTVSLVRIMPSGLPEYYISHNFRASENVGVVKLRPRASLALNLTGKSMTIGVWDSGSINSEHQEFGNRIDIRDNIPFDDHGTHVAGTIAAAGINPQAKGMAYEASLFAYEFNNDNSEMAAEAAGGLIISNHSYGLRVGWDVATGGTGWQWFGDPSVSNVEDYRFGYYDAANSRVWDDIAFNAPYYLIIKSAGNDRTDIGDGTRPPDGPYDCIEPKSVAKNILTIGAVTHLSGDYTGPDDVVMSEFSSWGPTDDGRIKPDIVGIGVNVFSCLSNAVDAYGFLSGTSMSAPNVTGSLALLQEYHAQLYSGNYMRSATLKGLVINTAKEAGRNPGPDYEFGWGLLSADEAANVLTRNDEKNFIVKELTLAENDSILIQVNSDGTAPLKATISWTDPPGTPPAIALDPPDLMLVNDLDMRIYDKNGNISMPWMLDPSKPDNGATTGDNFRDNVEKIEIANPVAGEYTIVIKHKNTLKNKKQDFSLIVTTAVIDPGLTTMYWIGGSGDWNDPTNWSFSSGGNVANAVPGLNNPVIFDQNSFTSPVNTIILTSNSGCYSLNYYAPDSCIFNLASFTLNVDGSVYDENGKLSIQNGKLSFKGTVSKNNQIRLSPYGFKNIDLDLVSVNGSWNIINDFKVNTLSVQNSSLYASGKQIEVATISIATNSGNIVDFSWSVIKGLNVMDISTADNVEFENSLILLSDATGFPDKTIIAGGANFHNMQISNANVVIFGDNTFNKIEAKGGLSLNGNNTIDSLLLSAGSALILQDNTSQTLTMVFEATGSSGNMIGISASGNAELFADNSNIRFCLDYLKVTNVSVSGRTKFLSGDNSVINAGSNGWIELNCNDALFPSFTVEYPCAMGQTKFTDTSTGFPTVWNWDFGDLQFPDENTSTAQNPFHQFRFPGIYEVTFNVKNNLFDETITQNVSVIEYSGGLNVPSINIDGTKLTSSVIAPNYQWYLNNNPITGATDRVFEIANPGIYKVAVFDDNCLFLSDATLVTALGEQINNQILIFPNPSKSGVISFRMTNDYYGKIRIVLHDIMGNKVMEYDLEKRHEFLEDKISATFLSQGIYQITVQMGNEWYTSKVVIQK